MRSRAAVTFCTHVRAYVLHLLRIPQGEGVVVAEGDKDTLLLHAAQVILSKKLTCKFVLPPKNTTFANCNHSLEKP